MPLLDKLFGKSPFGPVIQHAKKVYECIELVNPVIQAWLQEDWKKVEHLAKEVSDKEHEADKMKITIRSNLPKSLFYPVPRGDLLSRIDVVIPGDDALRVDSGLLEDVSAVVNP